MSHYFITSTGTEIGKTIVTASLTYQMKQSGKPIRAIKPIISGVTDTTMENSDTSILAEAHGLADTKQTWDMLTPFRYIAPLAPSMAARLEGRPLDTDKLLQFCQDTMNNHENVLIEGVGGAFVPLNNDMLVCDWIKALNIPSILVVGNYLGTISHTIATVEAMTNRGLAISGIIISQTNDPKESDAPDLEQTILEISNHTGIKTVSLPYLEDEKPWERAPDLLGALD